MGSMQFHAWDRPPSHLTSPSPLPTLSPPHDLSLLPRPSSVWFVYVLASGLTLHVTRKFAPQNLEKRPSPLCDELVAPRAAQRGTATPPQADLRTRVVAPGAQISVLDGARAVHARASATQRLGTERPALGANRCWC